MRRLLLPLGLAAAWLSPFAAGAQPAPLTLDQALDLAVPRNPALAVARREVDAAEAALRQASAGRNPAFSASVEDTRRATRTTTATLDLPLELGGQRAARMAAADRTRELAQAERDQAHTQLRATVVAAYFDVLAAQARVALATDAAELADRAAQAVARRVAAGKVSPVDATRAQVDHHQAALEATEARAELDTARHALASLWGDAEPRFDRVEGDTTAAPARAPLPELLQQLDDAPALRVARSEIERRRALVEVERRKATPDLTLSLGARRDNELGRTQAIVGVSLPLPLFDRNEGAVHEAGLRARQAEDSYQAVRLRLATELQAAASRLAVACASLQVLQTAVLPAAQQAHEAAARGFEAGKFGFLDVVDAQRTLLQARTRHLATLATAHQAAVAIDRLLGR